MNRDILAATQSELPLSLPPKGPVDLNLTQLSTSHLLLPELTQLSKFANFYIF